MRIVVIWQRFGPYHLARLQGAAEVGALHGAEIIGLEVARNDADYDWDVDLSCGSYTRHTIFPDRSYHQVTAKEISSAISEALEQLRPDAVAINGWGTPEARSAIAWCRQRPQVGAVLMSETKEDDRQRRWWSEFLKRRLVQRCDAALVGGKRQRDYLVKLGLDSNRIRFGYNVVDNRFFLSSAADVRRAAGAERAGLDLPENFFFACTRFLARKNIDGLLRAYARYRTLCRPSDPWDLVIAGSGIEEENLKRLEVDLDVDGVHWVGFVQYQNLPKYFGLASAFVHPAKAEAWGLVLNEAMASGLPILSSRSVGAAHELVESSGNGYLFDPWSEDDMSQALMTVATSSPDDRNRMAQRSQEIVADWSPERFGKELYLAATVARGDARP